MQRSHAIANGCFVAAVNRVGHEAPAGGDGIEFWGQSFIVAPSGEILAKASVEREEIIFADVEWKRVNEHRTHWPFLRESPDRRLRWARPADARLGRRLVALSRNLNLTLISLAARPLHGAEQPPGRSC